MPKWEYNFVTVYVAAGLTLNNSPEIAKTIRFHDDKGWELFTLATSIVETDAGLRTRHDLAFRREYELASYEESGLMAR